MFIYISTSSICINKGTVSLRFYGVLNTKINYKKWKTSMNVNTKKLWWHSFECHFVVSTTKKPRTGKTHFQENKTKPKKNKRIKKAWMLILVLHSNISSRFMIGASLFPRHKHKKKSYETSMNVKFGPSPSKKICFICFNEGPLKMIKTFLFHLKNSFCPQDIQIFFLTSWLSRKNSLTVI